MKTKVNILSKTNQRKIVFSDNSVGKTARSQREASRAMVAPPSQPGQALHPGEVLREHVEVYILPVQLLVRAVYTLGQRVAVGYRPLLYRIPSPGNASVCNYYCLENDNCCFLILFFSLTTLVSWLENLIGTPRIAYSMAAWEQRL